MGPSNFIDINTHITGRLTLVGVGWARARRLAIFRKLFHLPNLKLGFWHKLFSNNRRLSH